VWKDLWNCIEDVCLCMCVCVHVCDVWVRVVGSVKRMFIFDVGGKFCGIVKRMCV